MDNYFVSNQQQFSDLHDRELIKQLHRVHQQTGHDNKLSATYLEFEGGDIICKVKEGTSAVRLRDKRKVFLLVSMDHRIDVIGLLSIILEDVMCILLKDGF